MQQFVSNYLPGDAVLGPGNAQSVFLNSSIHDIVTVTPRLYQTFDTQFPPLFSEGVINYINGLGYSEYTSAILDNIEFAFRTFLWFADQWYAPWAAVVTYLVVVLTLQKIFLVPKAQRTNRWVFVSFLHNGIVALESLYMFVMFTKQLYIYLGAGGGYWQLYCDPSHRLDADGDYRFYASLFYLSKWHELFDTVLLVARGRPASTLQLFHHTVMLLVTYYNRWPYIVSGMWLSVYLNLIIHIAMYSYFALAAIGIRLESVRIYMTRCQILQFWIILLHAAPWPYFRHVYGCLGHISSWLWVVVPVTFINLLFLRFYIKSYHAPEKLKIQ